ncbi:MAG: hypothetical protein AAFR96_12275 [Planctomycetota bacterium]
MDRSLAGDGRSAPAADGVGLNAEPLQSRAMDDRLLMTIDGCGPLIEETDDRVDRAHGIKDADGFLRCAARLRDGDARPRQYHRSQMVTRYRVQSELVSRPGGGVRCRHVVRRVERVERVSFETRECDIADAERRLRHDLDTSKPDLALTETRRLLRRARSQGVEVTEGELAAFRRGEDAALRSVGPSLSLDRARAVSPAEAFGGDGYVVLVGG